MADDTGLSRRDRVPARETGAVLLALGGFGAAFAAASCCALPMLLGTLGLGGAWLFAIASIAAPHRLLWLGVAVLCLIAGGGLLLRQRRVAACVPGAACGRPVVTAAALAILALGGVLVALGLVFA